MVARLQHTDGREMTACVEYNQLEPLLIASGAGGDVNEADGYSKYPGNINGFMVNAAEYLRTLGATGGAIGEFINPKYADDERSSFRSPARLECMMQARRDRAEIAPTSRRRRAHGTGRCPDATARPARGLGLVPRGVRLLAM